MQGGKCPGPPISIRARMVMIGTFILGGLLVWSSLFTVEKYLPKQSFVDHKAPVQCRFQDSTGDRRFLRRREGINSQTQVSLTDSFQRHAGKLNARYLCYLPIAITQPRSFPLSILILLGEMNAAVGVSQLSMVAPTGLLT